MNQTVKRPRKIIKITRRKKRSCNGVVDSDVVEGREKEPVLPNSIYNGAANCNDSESETTISSITSTRRQGKRLIITRTIVRRISRCSSASSANNSFPPTLPTTKANFLSKKKDSPPIIKSYLEKGKSYSVSRKDSLSQEESLCKKENKLLRGDSWEKEEPFWKVGATSKVTEADCQEAFSESEVQPLLASTHSISNGSGNSTGSSSSSSSSKINSPDNKKTFEASKSPSANTSTSESTTTNTSTSNSTTSNTPEKPPTTISTVSTSSKVLTTSSIRSSATVPHSKTTINSTTASKSTGSKKESSSSSSTSSSSSSSSTTDSDFERNPRNFVNRTTKCLQDPSK